MSPLLATVSSLGQANGRRRIQEQKPHVARVHYCLNTRFKEMCAKFTKSRTITICNGGIVFLSLSLFRLYVRVFVPAGSVDLVIIIF